MAGSAGAQAADPAALGAVEEDPLDPARVHVQDLGEAAGGDATGAGLGDQTDEMRGEEIAVPLAVRAGGHDAPPSRSVSVAAGAGAWQPQ